MAPLRDQVAVGDAQGDAQQRVAHRPAIDHEMLAHGGGPREGGQGGEAAQVGLQMPFAITGIFQGMLLFFLLGSDVFIDNRLRRSA